MEHIEEILSPSSIKETYLPRAILSGGAQYAKELEEELDLDLEPCEERKFLLLKKRESSREERKKSLRQTNWRWFALALVCMVNFALYYCYQNPQALQPVIQSEFHIGDKEYNLLYSVYSLPNIVLPFFGGYLVDYLGVRVAINLFGAMLVIGQGVFTFGAYLKSFNVMIIGRFIFGLGGESLAVSQLPMVSRWFSSTQLSLAWGFGRAAIRVGSSLNSFFTPKIYVWTKSLFIPLLVGFFITVISWISGFVLSYMDKLADKQEGELQIVTAPKEEFRLRDLKTLPFIYFLLLLNYPFLYGSFFGLSNNINNMMVQRFGFSLTQVGNLVVIIYLTAALLGPFFGPFLDKYGRRITVMFFASLLFLAMGMFILFLQDRSSSNPNYGIIVPLSGISIFYALYSVVFWPCLPLIVEKKVLGTATGIITAVFNIMLTLFPILLGVIHDNTLQVNKGYFWSVVAICISIGLGSLITVWIYFEDKKKGRILEKSPKERQMELNAQTLVIDDDLL